MDGKDLIMAKTVIYSCRSLVRMAGGERSIMAVEFFDAGYEFQGRNEDDNASRD